MTDNVIKLHPEPYTIGAFVAEVDAEVTEFQATRAIVFLFNAKNESATMEFKASISDMALVACDAMGMVQDARAATMTMIDDE